VLSDRVTRRPGLAFAGLAGALLTVFGPATTLLDIESITDLFGIGCSLGIALAAYFRIAWNDRSLARAISMVALSSTAYAVAYVATFAMAVVARAFPPLLLASFCGGGAIGGMILSASTFSLYAETDLPIGPKVIACGVVGSVLGVAGLAIVRTLQPAAGFMQFSVSALYLVWQPGICAAMGMTWPKKPLHQRSGWRAW
jgi:hypothetical protein